MRELVRRHPALAALAAYVLVAVLATWPLVARFGTEIAGERAGPWEALWSFWWWGESLRRGASPLFTDALRWPGGMALGSRLANLPAALALLPLWPATPAVPEVALYNAVLFVSFPLAGFTTYLLCREVWGGHLAPFLAGALYTFGAHHLGAAAGPVDAVSLEWSPLYFLALVRTVRRHGVGPPLLAGVALALAATTSPYQLAGCAVGTVVLVTGWWQTDPRSIRAPDFLRRVGVLAVTFLALAGWFYRGLLADLGGGGRAGASADLVAFLVPAWWLGRGASVAPVYAGYVTLALAVVAWIRAKAARPWLAIAIVGAVLALGARLRLGGTALTPAILPWAWIGWAWRDLGSASAARLGWLVAFGLAMASCATLSLVIRAHRRGPAIAVALVAVAIVESWPGALPTSRWPAPRFLRNLATDGERWAVLDATTPERALWHQVLHRHPQLGGAVTATPAAVTTGSAIVDALVRRRVGGPAVNAAAAGNGAPTARPIPASQRSPALPYDAIRALQDRNVRFVIADEETLGTARALRLPAAYSGDGIVVFEVPAPTG